MRRAIERWGRTRIVALLGLALLVRALVPAGWMPVATADGVRLELCSAQDPAPRPMAGMHHGHEDGGKQTLSDHSCAFAGIGFAANDAPPPVVLALPPTPATFVGLRSLAVAIGRGLAAPPPPATGPPVFA